MKSGQPFFHPEMIGAFKIFHNKILIHRDNILDFSNQEFMNDMANSLINSKRNHLEFLNVSDILRDDWKIVTFTLDHSSIIKAISNDPNEAINQDKVDQKDNTSSDSTTIVAYIDGACSGNPGPGGWGIAIVNETGYAEYSGSSEGDTTNNIMELTAAIEFLRIASRNATLVIHADSEYVIKGITQWISGWKKNGWRNAQKKPVANKDLWIELDHLTAGRNITWNWVRGHNGNKGNTIADRLATSAIRQ